MLAPPEVMQTPVWDTATWEALPALKGDVEADICVVGLGGSGLACILELLELGQRVVGLDAASLAGGAAGRNGGFLIAGTAAFYHDAVAALGRERAKALYELSLRELERMSKQTPELVRRLGSLRIATSTEEEADCQLQLEAMQRDGLPVQAYDGPEGKGLLFPLDGAFNPLQRCRHLARLALAGGAQLFERSPVGSLSGTTVHTPHGSVRCRTVIVAVDGKLEQLFPELASNVRTARLQMLATAPTGELSLPRPVYARFGYEYWQQLPGGIVALGGFRDAGGEAEWTSQSEPGDKVQARLEAFLRQHLGVQAPVTHRWAAPVGYTASGLPVFKQVREGIWAAGGYSGTGNLIGALCGRCVAQLVVTGKSVGADYLLND